MYSGANDKPDWRFSLRLALGVGAFSAIAVAALHVSTGTVLERVFAKEQSALVLDRREDVRLAWQYSGEQGVIDLLADVETTTGEQLAIRVEDTGQSVLFDGATASAPETPWDELDASAPGQEKRVATSHGWTATAVRLPSGHVVRVARFSTALVEVRQAYRGVLASVVVPLLLGGVVGGFVLVMVALRPLRRTVAVMRHILQTGDWAARVTVPKGKGEMRDLTIAFNAVLERQQRLVESLRQSLDCVAHDLRTPMTRLHVAVENGLRQVPADGVAREALIDSLEEAQRVQATLDTLLDVAEAEAGAMKLNLDAIEASELLAEVADLYEFAAEEKGASISIRVTAKLGFTGDRARLRRALANLVDNALKYLGTGRSIVLSASMAGDEVALTVEDDGIGIAPEHMARIWDRLYRIDRSRSAPGMGLGLSLVRAIAEAHGGKALVRSEIGRGSVFELRLPRLGPA